MKKKISKITAVLLAVLTLFSTFSAFAATNYANSVGSVTEDIAVLNDTNYTAVGQDTTQGKKSAYSSYQLTDETITSKCDVYATIAEGSKVYDPTNPDADDDGFVDGEIVVSVPTVLIMSGTPDSKGNFTASGLIKVKGNIAGTTVINVIPASTVTLKQNGKDDITADITQQYTKFTVPTSDVTGSDVNKNVTPSFNNDAVSTIIISNNTATAGSWHGSYETSLYLSTAA